MAARVREVIWAESARDALDAVIGYIAQDSQQAAVQVLDEALLRSREPAANALDRIESERGQGVLVQGVEVRSMVRGTDLHEHPNDYSEKARQFRHGGTLHRPSGFRRAHRAK